MTTIGSKFGGFLDMISDRMGTLIFLIMLIRSFPEQCDPMIVWAIVDIMSHWCATLS